MHFPQLFAFKWVPMQTDAAVFWRYLCCSTPLWSCLCVSSRSEAICAPAHEHGSNITRGEGRTRRRSETVRGQMRCLFCAPSSPAVIISWRWSTVSHCGFWQALALAPAAGQSGLWEDQQPTEPGFVSCKNIFLVKKKRKNKTCARRWSEWRTKKKTLRETSRENKVFSHNQLLLCMRAAAVLNLLDLWGSQVLKRQQSQRCLLFRPTSDEKVQRNWLQLKYSYASYPTIVCSVALLASLTMVMLSPRRPPCSCPLFRGIGSPLFFF